MLAVVSGSMGGATGGRRAMTASISSCFAGGTRGVERCGVAAWGGEWRESSSLRSGEADRSEVASASLADGDGGQAAGCLNLWRLGGGEGGESCGVEASPTFFLRTSSFSRTEEMAGGRGLVLLVDPGELSLDGGARRFSLPGLTSITGDSCGVTAGWRGLCDSRPPGDAVGCL